MKKATGQAHKLNILLFEVTGDVVVTNGFVGKCRTIRCHAVAVVKIQNTFPETPKCAQLNTIAVPVSSASIKPELVVVSIEL